MFNKSIEEVVKELGTDIESGLDNKTVENNQNKYGKNVLQETKKTSLFVKFLLEFKDVLIIILIVAAIVSIIVDPSEWVDSLIIFIVVIVNAILGVVQESKAEKSLEALKKMSSPNCKVIRDGKMTIVASEELTIGDLIFLEAGDIVPCDCRIVESNNLTVDESSLTGESLPVEKNNQIIQSEVVAVADRHNMLFSSCYINNGNAKCIVTSIGMDTQIGHIASALDSNENNSTPLQDKLTQVGKSIGFICIGVCLIVFLLEYISGVGGVFKIFDKEVALDSFKSAIALAVAAIPEGLATVVTVVLALGVEKMAKRNAIVKKLPAVETLGSTQIICSDKTGTLTQNKMTVTKLYVDEVKKAELADEKEKQMLAYFALCCSAQIQGDKRIGDPTELALLDVNNLYGLDISNIEKLSELPFDSDRKLMSVLVKQKEKFIMITKGAFDIVLDRSNATDKDKAKFINASEVMANEALRVLAIGVKEFEDVKDLELSDEANLTLLGFVGMIDPSREEVKDAIAIAKKAGIRTIMITGDHKITASAIARDLGIMGDNDKVITSLELNELSEEYLNDHIEEYSVYARVAPSDKVRIVKAWKNKNKVVAMTGDGVNDAPALKLSDIGCAMGITGTDVSKEASDMILMDDNFTTIVEAVKEGRGIYNNIRKCVKYLLSSNIGEVITIFIASVIAVFSTIELGIPLLPIHLLWINLITDSLPAFGLGMEKASSEVMEERPRDKDEGFFANKLGLHIAFEGICIGLLTLTSYLIGILLFKDSSLAQTMAFFTLSSLQLFHAYNVKSDKSVFSKDTFNNKMLNIAFILGMSLQFIVIYTPGINYIFKLTPLTILPLLTSLGVSLVIVVIMELYKLISKRSSKK